LKIPRSKNNQLRQGDEVLIARMGSETCPVAMLEEYMKKRAGSNQKLFRGIVSGKVAKLQADDRLSHTRMAELLKEKLLELGFTSGDLVFTA